MEADLRAASSTSTLPPPPEEPLSGWQRHEKALTTNEQQDRASSRRRGEWQRFQERQKIDEDAGLAHDAVHHHARNTMYVPQNVQVQVAVTQTKEGKDAIQGSGRRSIPKKAVGRGSMVNRTHENPHVDAGRNVGRQQLGASVTTLHRPLGFGSASGSVVIG